MEQFIAGVHTQLADAVADREYHDLHDSFTITRTDDGRVAAEATLVVEEPEPLGSGTIEGRGPNSGELTSYYEDLVVPLDGDVAADADSYLKRLEEVTTFHNESCVDVYDPVLFCAEPEHGVSGILDFTIELTELPFEFETLSGAVASEETADINDAARIVSVRVQSPLYDDFDSTDAPATSPDYTIVFTTDKPHEMWSDYDTLHDYAEAVAKNNDETTVEDVLNWETYYNHFHICGNIETNAVVQRETEEILNDFVSVSTDGLRVGASEFRASVRDGESVGVTGSVAGWISELSSE